MKTAASILAVQLLALAVLFFGDIGFDKAGRYGLDFSHFLMLVGVQLVGLAGSLSVSLAKKSWLPVSASCAIVAVGAAVVFSA